MPNSISIGSEEFLSLITIHLSIGSRLEGSEKLWLPNVLSGVFFPRSEYFFGSGIEFCRSNLLAPSSSLIVELAAA